MRALRPISGRRYLGAVGSAAFASALAALCASHSAQAASEPKERAITSSEVVSWLDANGEQPKPTDAATDEEELVPPPPPRHIGFVLESGLGAFGQLGEMKHVSPLAPWFHVQFGYEPLRFLMLFAEADLVLSSTSYAPPPPPPRSYGLWGVGGGLRGTLKASERVGLYLQASMGGAAVSADVLGIYGYRHADTINVYFAGELGVEWYQVNPHLALSLHAGIRDYTATFKRDFSSAPPLAWVSALGLRYTF